MSTLSLSLGPRSKINPSVGRFQYRTRGRKRNFSDLAFLYSMILLPLFPCVILEVIYAPDEVWGRD